METLKDPSLFRQKCLIDGAWCDAATAASVPVTNPATQDVIGHVPDISGEETRRAIKAAQTALALWKAKTHAERAALLEAWYRLMVENEQDLAMILTIEQGKPLAEALGEIRYGASFVKWFAEEARRIGGTTIPSPTPDRRIIVLKEAVGVCAVITPWNFPNAMITRKVAPALAATAQWWSSRRSSPLFRLWRSAYWLNARAFLQASSTLSPVCPQKLAVS